MIIDFTYFQSGKLYVPGNVSNPSVTGNTPSRSSEVDAYIDQYEEELLLGAIGYTNYTALKAAILADPKLVLAENAIWKDLVNGKVYSFNDTQVEWKGLRQEGTINKSLIAEYVFYHYLKDDFQNYTTTGIQREKAKNAEGQSPEDKLVKIWRLFIQQYQFGCTSTPLIVSYGSKSYTDYFSTQFNVNRSLFQFLQDNDVYGDYHFKTFDNRNRFGI